MSAPPLFIVGAGAVGTYLAAQFLGVTRVTLISRGNWRRVSKFPPNSTILVTTKAYDLPEVLRRISPRADGSECVVFCQNGLGIPGAHVNLPMRWARLTCWFGVRIAKTRGRAPILRVAGGRGIELAPGTAASAPAVLRLARLLSSAGFSARVARDLRAMEWKKVLGNIATNGLCALAQAPNRAAYENPHLKRLADRLVDEARTVARAEGVRFTDGNIRAIWRSLRKTGPNLNSTLLDLRAGRPTEIRWLNDEVARRGSRRGIQTPANRLVADLILALENPR